MHIIPDVLVESYADPGTLLVFAHKDYHQKEQIEEPRLPKRRRGRPTLEEQRRFKELELATISDRACASNSSASIVVFEGPKVAEAHPGLFRFPQSDIAAIVERRFDTSPWIRSPIASQIASICCCDVIDTTSVVGVGLCRSIVAQSGSVLSKTARAAQLGIGRKTLDKYHRALASTIVQAERSYIGETLRRLQQNSRVSFRFFGEFNRWDETSMYTVVKVRSDRRGTRRANVCKGESRLVTRSDFNVDILRQLTGDRTPSIWKLLQSEVKWVSMLDMKDVLKGSTRVCLIGRPRTHVQVMKDTSAQTTLGCIRNVSVAGSYCNPFYSTHRLTNTDRHPSNFAAERMLMEERPGWSNNHHGCSAHISMTCQTNTLDYLRSDISGCVHYALAVSLGSNWHHFRQCLEDEVRSTLSICRGSAGPSAALYRSACVRCFLPRAVRRYERELTIRFLPNGNWQNSEEVEVWIPDGEGAIDEEAVKNTVASGILFAFASKRFKIYAKSRWNDSDISVGSIGLIFSCHDLGRRTLRRFCNKFESPGRAVVGIDGEFGQDHNVGGAGQAEEPSVVPDVDQQQLMIREGGGTNEQAFDFHSKSRNSASTWIASDPFPRILVLRLVLELPQRYIRSLYFFQTPSWERTQQVKELKAKKKGLRGVHREFMCLVAARGSLETTLYRQLELLMVDARLWTVIPDRYITVKLNAVAFLMCSRLGCQVEQNLAHRHRSYPFKLYLWLEDPSLATSIRSASDCMKTSWVLDFLRQFPLSDDITECEESFDVLVAIMRELHDEMIEIEAKHATLRRLLKGKGVQTHTLDVEELSADFVLRGRQEPAHAGDDGQQPGDPLEHDVGEDAGAGRVRKRGGGGAWRAFISLFSSGFRNFAELADEYHRTDEATLAECKELGRTATNAFRQTGSGFGGRRKAQPMNQLLLDDQAAALSRLGGSDVARSDFVDQLYRRAGGDLQEARRLARAMHSLETKQGKKLEQEEERELKEFQNGAGRELRDRLCEAFPDIACFGTSALRPIPSATCPTFEFEVPLEKACAATAIGLTTSKSNFGLAMASDWSIKHAVNDFVGEHANRKKRFPMHNDHETKENKRSKFCLDYGMCVCRNGGRQAARLYLFRNAWHLRFKRVFCRGSAFEKLALEGSIVVRLLATKKLTASERRRAELVGDTATGIVDERWWHIGWLSKSPYRPTFSEMEICNDTVLLIAEEKWLQVIF